MHLDEVPDGYRAMKEREAIKVMVELSVAPMEVAAQTSHTAARKEGTAMSAWTSDQLDKIAAAEEPRIRTTRREGKAIRIEILKDPTASAQ